MANFEVQGRIHVRSGVTAEDVANVARGSLIKHYNPNAVLLTERGLQIEGNLSSFWERAITLGIADIKVEDDELTYKVNGSSALGGWPWLWLGIGVFIQLFLIWFFFDLVEYLLCRDRPKAYIEEAFKLVEFEYGA